MPIRRSKATKEARFVQQNVRMDPAQAKRICEQPLVGQVKTYFVPPVVVEHGYTPVIFEVIIADDDICVHCKTIEYYGPEECCCEEDRYVNVTFRIVSTVGDHNTAKPHESIYDVRIYKINISAGVFNFDTCLCTAECTNRFTVQDSIDEYTGNAAKEMVSASLIDKECFYRITATNFNQKQQPLYERAFDSIVEKILNQNIVQAVDENPHVGRRKKKSR